jgi:hypothetical protein
MFTSIIRSHSSIFEPLERRLRHQAGVVDHHIDASVGLHGGVDQFLDLLAVADVRHHGDRLAAPAGQLACQGLEAIGAPRSQHDARALLG